MKYWIKQLTPKEQSLWEAWFNAWEHINEKLAHETYLDLKTDNYTLYPQMFECLLAQKWNEYSRGN